jgi:putative flippase GtrA
MMEWPEESRQVTGAWPRWLKFACVGALGFVIDGGLLTIGVNFLRFDPIPVRLISFSTAVLATWWGHRHFSFRGSRGEGSQGSRPREIAAYTFVSLTGVLINWLVFSFVLTRWTLASQYPVIALVPAAILAAVANYSGSVMWVWPPADRGPPTLNALNRWRVWRQ